MGANHPGLIVTVDSSPDIMQFEETELHFVGEKLSMMALHPTKMGRNYTMRLRVFLK